MDFDEVVETSDAEELAEIERTEVGSRIQRARTTAEEATPPPRKKIKLFYTADEDGETGVLSPGMKNELIELNSPQRSQSSFTMFAGNTSPGLLFASRSPTGSPGQFYDIQSLPKTEEDDVVMEFSPPPPEDSQDPLLLHSPTRPLTASRPPSPLATPLHVAPPSIPQPATPLPTQRHSSPPLQFPSSPMPTQSQDVNAAPQENDIPTNDLLVFTPTKTTSERSRSPSRSPSIDPFRHLFSSRDSSPEHEPSPSSSRISENGDGTHSPNVTTIAQVVQPQEDASVVLANELHEELNERGRYSLRKRTVTQKMPFTTEDIRYKRQLKGIPEAIVKYKALERHHHHHHPQDRYEEDGETQQDSFVDDAEDDALEQMERQRKRRRIDGPPNEAAKPDVSHYPEILRGFPDTDEDEDMDMDTITREARRLMKQRAKEQKAKEKEERDKKAREEKEILKAKRFPVHKPRLQSPRRKSPVDSVDDGKDDTEKGKESSERLSQPFNHGHNAPQSSKAPSTSISAAMQDYFGQDEDYGDNDDNPYHQLQEPLEDHLEWDPNPPINDYNFIPPSPVATTSHEELAPVDLDEDGASDTDREEEPAKSESTGIELDLDSKKARTLNKMYPTFMVKKMTDDASGTKKPKSRRIHEKKKDSGDEGPPQAGQTRKQISTHPKDIREIKGDSESELDLSNSNSDGSTDPDPSSSSSSDDEGDRKSSISSGHHRRIVKKEKGKVIHLAETSSDENDDLPSKWLRRQRKSNGIAGRMRDTSQIDYMLSKSSRLEPKQSRRTKSAGGGQSRFKHDIMTAPARKYGRERQTTLDSYRNGPSTSHGARRSGKRKTPRHDLDDFSDDEKEHDVRLSDAPNDSVQKKKMDRKKKYKERKRKEKTIGLHVFSGEGYKIVTGRRQIHLNVSNTEFEEFQRVLLPSSQTPNHIDWSKEYAPPLVEQRPKRRSLPDGTSNNHQSDVEVSTRTSPSISIHFNLPILQPGKSFGPSTYIKKGWLYQLTTLDTDIPRPFFSASTILGIEMAPDMSAEQLCALLPNVFENLLEYATGLPDPDSDFTRHQWLALMRGLSQLTSWQLKNSSTKDASKLRDTVQREVSQLVEQIEQASLSFIDTPVLIVSWFMVDMSVRIQDRSCPPASPEGVDKPLKYSASLLMQCLLKFGINKTMQVLLDEIDLDGKTPAPYCLELWVCLIHVLSIGTKENDGDKLQKQPFWLLLKDALNVRVTELNTRTPFESSEDTWFTIFSVCTLSQFSVHGMTLSHYHLPADWTIVSFAFRRMHLGKVLHNEHATLFDRYISVIVDRCWDLYERYQWKIDDTNAYTAFNELAEIFRTRKFANLLHEDPEYSEFFRKAKWDLLPSRSRNDSAFTVFLKLVVHAALSDKLRAAGKPSPRVKKLLSIVMPMGSLPFTEENKPQDRDLAKFYNRMTALVVAGDLDRHSIDDRVQKARGYINFAKADFKSRVAIIRALRTWGIMLVDREMSLKAFSPWIEEITGVLSTELKQLPGIEPGKNAEEQRVNENLVNLVVFLLCALRNFNTSCGGHKRYPYASFLEILRPLLVQSTLDFSCAKFADEYIRLTETFFWARSEALSPPPRPAIQAVDEDSQGLVIKDDLVNVDWSGLNCVDLSAASAPQISRSDDDDEKLFQAAIKKFKFTPIMWAVFRGLKVYLLGSKGTGISELKDCRRWLHSWFGFASNDKGWVFSLEKVDAELEKCPSEHWIRDVQLCVMLTVIKYEPLQYLTYTERVFGSLLNALISINNISSTKRAHNSFEREYMSWVFSIDGLTHPLLSNMVVDLPARNETSGDYEFEVDGLRALRVPLLRAIFKNLEKHITLQLRGTLEISLDTGKYVKLCTTMFSGMRNNLTRLEKPSAKFTEYHDFCNQVVDALQGNRELCERMTFWANWRP